MVQADPELESMQKIAVALDGLTADARSRVLRWAADRYNVGDIEQLGEHAVGSKTGAPEADFQDFASFYDRAKPSIESEKALVAGYWLQQKEGQKDFTALGANNLLKDLGHPITTIPREFIKLIKAKPNLVMLVRKSGKTKQARKTYRLTAEGIKRVDSIMAGKTEAR